MKKTTANDIAKACGVSQATVSYVINQKQGKSISDDVRKLVLDTAKQMNYYPNNTARSMRLHKSLSIGLVIGANSVNLTFNSILKGIKRCADQRGYTITLLTDGEHDGENGMQMADQLLSYFCSDTIDGVIFLFYEMNDDVLKPLQEKGIPYVLVGETGISGQDLNLETGLEQVIDTCILYCAENGLKRITYLLFGHKPLNFVAGFKYGLFSKKVQELYPQAAFQTRYVPFDNTDDQLKILIADMLQDIDIVVTASPRLTFLTQGVIMQKNFKVPQYVKLISLNHSRMFDLVYPTITHLDIPLVQMGEYATTYLLNQIDGGHTEPACFWCTLKKGMSTL